MQNTSHFLRFASWGERNESKEIEKERERVCVCKSSVTEGGLRAREMGIVKSVYIYFFLCIKKWWG